MSASRRLGRQCDTNHDRLVVERIASVRGVLAAPLTAAAATAPL
jgi:hypothetical protein